MNETDGSAVASRPDARDDGFDGFYRREYLGAVRLAWLLTGSPVASEDVVHDAMTAMYSAFDRLDTPSAYLRRAVINGSRSWRRDERRQRERAALVAQAHPALDGGDRELLAQVAGLPYRQRVVIVARYWGGWSEAEIAASLGCRPGTVKSLASRALNQLHKEIGT